MSIPLKILERKRGSSKSRAYYALLRSSQMLATVIEEIDTATPRELASLIEESAGHIKDSLKDMKRAAYLDDCIANTEPEVELIGPVGRWVFRDGWSNV